MDDLGNYIYLIIIIIAAISGILKKKAKKPVAKPVMEDDDDDVDYEEILRKLDSKPVPPKETKFFRTEVFDSLNKPIVSYDNVEDVTKLRAKKTVEVHDEGVDEFPVSGDESKGLDVKLNTAEDARMAFIYSEILQRKY